MADERLINKDPSEEEDKETELPFYKSDAFILVVKLSLALGVISSLLTGIILTNLRLGALEHQITEFTEQVSTFQNQHEVVTINVKLLTESHRHLESTIGTLDLGAAKGELSQAITILDTQSEAINKHLAVTRNGLLSLSRMLKGSRVWQDDYTAQFDNLFNDNANIKSSIKTLRGIQEEPKKTEPKFIQMDF